MKHKRLSIILAALAVIGPFSVDTYFASFPDMAAHFRITELEVQQTLSLYLLALAGMNLFHGSLSDSFGRRKIINTALTVYTIAAVGCSFVDHFATLLGLRFVCLLNAPASFAPLARDVLWSAAGSP